MEESEKPVALFDMDGTLCDFEEGMRRGLEEIRSPYDPKTKLSQDSEVPEWLKRRERMIKSDPEWWSNLPRFKLGWDLLEISREIGYDIMILTQTPLENPAALAGKLKWINTHLPGQKYTMTRDKSLVYGKVLVDDYTEYINGWFKWRARGYVVMPASEQNKSFTHSRVLRYDGTNLEEARQLLIKVKDRKPGELIS